MEDAPPLEGITAWVNGDPVTLDALEGNAVLLDFWSAADLACRHDLPFLRRLADAYADAPVRVIGVHTPLYGFERDTAYLEDAVDRLDIDYRVALDAAGTAFERYGNVQRPRRAVIDPVGRIQAEYRGRGRHASIEDAVRRLVRAAGGTPGDRVVSPDAAEPVPPHRDAVVSPRVSAGHGADLGNDRTVVSRTALAFTDPGDHALNTLYLDGEWMQDTDHVRAESAGTAAVRWTGTDAYAVLAPEDDPVDVSVDLDGTPVPGQLAGADVDDGTVTVDRPGLYHLVARDAPAVGELALEMPPDSRLYACDFA